MPIHLLLAALLTAGTIVHAQSYPAKPIRMVVPFTPAGGADTLARIIAQNMSASFQQQVVVDNRGGAGGTIGTEIVARSDPDGYTLIMGTSTTHAINASLFSKLRYDPVKDFSAVTLCASTAYILALNPSVPAKSVMELIARAKSRPGQLNYASAGNGTAPHLAAELLKSMAKINIVGITYNGGGPAIAATLSGEVQMTFGAVAVTLPHVKSGKLVALAVTSLQRSKLVPELPTVSEAGVPGYEAIAWYGVLAPAKTPVPVINKLDHEIKRVLKSPDVMERLAALGYEPIPTTPEEFAAYIKAEIPKWAKVVKEAGIHTD